MSLKTFSPFPNVNRGDLLLAMIIFVISLVLFTRGRKAVLGWEGKAICRILISVRENMSYKNLYPLLTAFPIRQQHVLRLENPKGYVVYL